MLNTALDILKLINKKGYEGYIVGGFVRDRLLGIDSSDIDITTNMPHSELIKYYDIDTTTIKHGSFILKINNFTFEVTNFRKELSYSKQRHPEIELVKSYKEDYIRRDFTINALCYDYNMDIIDYCNGVNDLDNRLVKTIREPNLTLIEDPVRILRAIYFKNKYNLKYEDNTYNALINNAKETSNISYNRLYNELSKLFYDFNKNINDLINTKVVKYINLKDSINYVFSNKLNVKSVNDLIAIEYYLGNDISKWEINSNEKKNIISFVSIVKSNYNNRVVFDNMNNISKAFGFSKLINVSYNVNVLNDLLIKDIKDINFNFKELVDMVNKLDIKNMKNLIIDKILNNELNNNNNDIVEFINNFKK